MKWAICGDCKKMCKPRMSVKVDGVLHHHCQACWEAHRQSFVKRLMSGDAKAWAIFNAVTEIESRRNH